MGLDLNGTTITNQSNSLVIANTNTALTLDATGRLIRGSFQPIFYASHTGNSWVGYSATGWNQFPFNSTEINQNNCFNTGSYTFTAPVTGAYLFTANTYHYDASMDYMHPQFTINDSLSGRMPYTTAYRLRSYLQADGHSFDTNCCALYYLYAGDYAKYFFYLPNGTMYFLGYTTHWAGFLLG